jgi:hypothetical protein
MIDIFVFIQVIVDSFGPHGIVCLIMPWYVKRSHYIIIIKTR